MTMMSGNFSDSITLEDLNAEEVKLYIGGAILICLFSLTGTIGNCHVLAVFIFRMKKSNNRTFIIFLAILDLITCVVGMPFVVVTLCRPIMFNNSVLCKILSLNNFFICISSAGILMIISVDRFRKICFPLGRQMSHTVAKVMCVVAMGVAFLLSSPVLILYGSSPVPTSHPNLTGYECNVLAEYKDTRYPVYFNGTLLIVSGTSFITLVVLYCFIGRVIWKNRVFRFQSQTSAPNFRTESLDSPTRITSGMDESPIPAKKQEVKEKPKADENLEADKKPCSLKETDTAKCEPQENTDKKTSSELQRLTIQSTFQKKIGLKARYKFNRTVRVTMMLFWITLIFLISYVPYTIIRIASYMNPQWYTEMSHAGKVTYNTLLWCVYMNNMANSIIYGVCDERFRNAIKLGYSKFFKSLKCN